MQKPEVTLTSLNPNSSFNSRTQLESLYDLNINNTPIQNIKTQHFSITVQKRKQEKKKSRFGKAKRSLMMPQTHSRAALIQNMNMYFQSPRLTQLSGSKAVLLNQSSEASLHHEPSQLSLTATQKEVLSPRVQDLKKFPALGSNKPHITNNLLKQYLQQVTNIKSHLDDTSESTSALRSPRQKNTSDLKTSESAVSPKSPKDNKGWTTESFPKRKSPSKRYNKGLKIKPVKTQPKVDVEMMDGYPLSPAPHPTSEDERNKLLKGSQSDLDKPEESDKDNKSEVSKIDGDALRQQMQDVLNSWDSKVESTTGPKRISRICTRHQDEKERLALKQLEQEEAAWIKEEAKRIQEEANPKPKISPKMRMLKSTSRKSISPKKLNYFCHGKTSTHNPDAQKVNLPVELLDKIKNKNKKEEAQKDQVKDKPKEESKKQKADDDQSLATVSDIDTKSPPMKSKKMSTFAPDKKGKQAEEGKAEDNKESTKENSENKSDAGKKDADEMKESNDQQKPKEDVKANDKKNETKSESKAVDKKSEDKQNQEAAKDSKPGSASRLSYSVSTSSKPQIETKSFKDDVSLRKESIIHSTRRGLLWKEKILKDDPSVKQIKSKSPEKLRKDISKSTVKSDFKPVIIKKGNESVYFKDRSNSQLPQIKSPRYKNDSTKASGFKSPIHSPRNSNVFQMNSGSDWHQTLNSVNSPQMKMPGFQNETMYQNNPLTTVTQFQFTKNRMSLNSGIQSPVSPNSLAQGFASPGSSYSNENLRAKEDRVPTNLTFYDENEESKTLTKDGDPNFRSIAELKAYLKSNSLKKKRDPSSFNYNIKLPTIPAKNLIPASYKDQPFNIQQEQQMKKHLTSQLKEFEQFSKNTDLELLNQTNETFYQDKRVDMMIRNKFINKDAFKETFQNPPGLIPAGLFQKQPQISPQHQTASFFRGFQPGLHPLSTVRSRKTIGSRQVSQTSALSRIQTSNIRREMHMTKISQRSRKQTSLLQKREKGVVKSQVSPWHESNQNEDMLEGRDNDTLEGLSNGMASEKKDDVALTKSLIASSEVGDTAVGVASTNIRHEEETDLKSVSFDINSQISKSIKPKSITTKSLSSKSLKLRNRPRNTKVITSKKQNQSLVKAYAEDVHSEQYENTDSEEVDDVHNILIRGDSTVHFNMKQYA